LCIKFCVFGYIVVFFKMYSLLKYIVYFVILSFLLQEEVSKYAVLSNTPVPWEARFSYIGSSGD